ncbi:cation transporter [Mesorhizobium sp. IMUNJ 23232]|uniref:cation transporter n=1 Tax=Mesorhizobium sp. IMUNJ 23232 TaxID=3376064 RepID=UPI00379F52F5
MRTDTPCTRNDTQQIVRTARHALLAAAPGLVLTAIAAASSTSLTIRADLALTFLDMTALVSVWVLAERRHRRSGGSSSHARGETIASALVALCMTLSMTIVAIVAVQRIMAGGMVPQGGGVMLGAALNVVYGVMNFWILRRWRARGRDAPSALVRSQICLFSDKLSSNVLIAAALVATITLGDTALARFIDPVASLLIAAATARWAIPVVRETVLAMRTALRRSARSAALAKRRANRRPAAESL